jgi:hypothetical protein
VSIVRGVPGALLREARPERVAARRASFAGLPVHPGRNSTDQPIRTRGVHHAGNSGRHHGSSARRRALPIAATEKPDIFFDILPAMAT